MLMNVCYGVPSDSEAGDSHTLTSPLPPAECINSECHFPPPLYCQYHTVEVSK